MKDVNWPLRKAYTTALENVGVPVYYQQADDNENSDLFIVFSGIRSADESTKTSSDTGTEIEVRIHARKDKFNQGKDPDEFASLVFDAIYPTPTSVLDLSEDGMQMVGTRLVSDNTIDYGTAGNAVYIDRIIRFRHEIFIL